VQVQVLHVDPDTQRIGLSIKRLQPDPWVVAVDKYAPGQLVRGTVAHVAKFGAFVELEPGVEGLIHISELADIAVAEPLKVVHAGDKVTVKVLRVDPKRQRIGLSIRQAGAPAEA